MFEQKRSAGWGVSWAGIVLVVVFVIVVFWIFKQNPPEASGTVEKKPMWTTGTIVSGPLEVEAGGVLTFPMNLNKKSALDVSFFTGDSQRRLGLVIVRKIVQDHGGRVEVGNRPEPFPLPEMPGSDEGGAVANDVPGAYVNVLFAKLEKSDDNFSVPATKKEIRLDNAPTAHDVGT